MAVLLHMIAASSNPRIQTRAQSTIRHLLDDALKPSGLTSREYRFLRLVAEAENLLVLKDVANALKITASSLSRQIGPLERAGLIQLTRDTRDRRIRRPRLTESGHATFRTAQELWQIAHQCHSSDDS